MGTSAPEKIPCKLKETDFTATPPFHIIGICWSSFFIIKTYVKSSKSYLQDFLETKI